MCSCDTEQSINVNGRALHYVLKIPNRKKSVQFYKNILGMKVLRHEEFDEGSEPFSGNWAYDNRWSKTMVGYGPEDYNFVFELTYNYPIHFYEKGNDLVGVTIISQNALQRARDNNWPISNGNTLQSPGGYKFFIMDKPLPDNRVEKITLASTDMNRTIGYWNCLLGMKVFAKDDENKKRVLFGFNQDETKIEFVEIGERINRAEAFGRIAFSCHHDQQPMIEMKVRRAKQTIKVPLTSLETPRKATVRVIILADPDGHEICFVDDGPFRQLSKYSPEDEQMLEIQIKKDKGQPKDSDEEIESKDFRRSTAATTESATTLENK